MTPAQLKSNYVANAPALGGKFFARDNMRFLGDTMANFGVRSAGFDNQYWELYRKRPVNGGNQGSAFFCKSTFHLMYKSSMREALVAEYRKATATLLTTTPGSPANIAACERCGHLYDSDPDTCDAIDHKVWTYGGFYDTLSFAESLGWTNWLDDVDDSDSLATIDQAEDEAVSFIEGLGWRIIDMD